MGGKLLILLVALSVVVVLLAACSETQQAGETPVRAAPTAERTSDEPAPGSGQENAPEKAEDGRPPALDGGVSHGEALPQRCLDRLPGPRPEWCDKVPQPARTYFR
jgi:hypothetical protein